MPHTTSEVRLLVSLLSVSEAPRTLAVRRLAALFGPLDYLSRPLPFTQTDYYAPEMGGPLDRRLASFRELVPAHGLAAIKRACQAAEAELAQPDGRRLVNIDPGLLSADSFILASGKAQGHRLALAPDQWAEVTLWFHHGQFHSLPWTYPDYSGEQMRKLLKSLRGRYLWQLKQRSSQGDKP